MDDANRTMSVILPTETNQYQIGAYNMYKQAFQLAIQTVILFCIPMHAMPNKHSLRGTKFIQG